MLKYSFPHCYEARMFHSLMKQALRARLRAKPGAGAPPASPLGPLWPLWLFLREFVRDPAAVGAFCPSSDRLADRIAAQLTPDAEGWVVELGAGTGVVTAALLRRGVRADRLIVIERSRHMVRHLRKRFPQVRVILGDAGDGRRLIPACLPLAALVSSLPLRSLPAGQVTRITGAWCDADLAGLHVVQYTYAPRASSAWVAAGLARTHSETVWSNLPPARVEVFCAQ